MVYYVLAMQCLSTVAVVKRETNGWKWPLFMIGYMTALAWGVTFLVYHVGLALGWGDALKVLHGRCMPVKQQDVKPVSPNNHPDRQTISTTL